MSWHHQAVGRRRQCSGVGEHGRMAGDVRGRVKGVVGGRQTGYGERKWRSRRREAAEVMRGVRQVVFGRKIGRVVAVITKERQDIRNTIHMRTVYELKAVIEFKYNC